MESNIPMKDEDVTLTVSEGRWVYAATYKQRVPDSPECEHCGRTLSFHHFDVHRKTYYCRPDWPKEFEDYEVVKIPSETPYMPAKHPTAPDILKRAAQHMEDRAAQRDQPGGERSMTRTVAAFNALTGHALSERDGWIFMVVLKAARACTTSTGIADDYEDLAAYAGLAGESAQQGENREAS